MVLTYKKQPSTQNASNTLGNDVQKGIDEANFASKEKSTSDCWIDMATTDVTNGLGHGGNSDAKSKGNSVKRVKL